MTSETVRVLDEADLGNDCPISTNEEVIGLLRLQAQAWSMAAEAAATENSTDPDMSLVISTIGKGKTTECMT